ncbi:hypothetical protein AB1A55_16025, partial [Lactiplantibacillus plantarum]|uniref:hypothetical protein n=1 Tax=Lactiplantibacillus plantarum TaxID=1590 RepID=UPI003454714D
SNTIFPTVQSLASEVNSTKSTIVQENSAKDTEIEESTTKSGKVGEEEANSDLSSNSEKASEMKTGESQNANDSPFGIELEEVELQVKVMNEVTDNIQNEEKSDSGFPGDIIYFINGIQMLNGQVFHPSATEINDEMNRLMQDESLQIESDGHT